MFKIACHSLTWGNYYKNGSYSIESILKDIKEAGFEGVELFEPLSKFGSPQQLEALLDKYGLKLATLSGNLNLTSSDNKDMEEAEERIRFLNTLKVDTFMLCGGWIKNPREKSDINFERFSERLEKLSSFAKELNVSVAYHPHLNCITETKGDIDKLFKNIKLTKLCLDTAHLTAAGSNPIEIIKKYQSEIKLIHLKDWDAKLKRFTELGAGVIGGGFWDIVEQIKFIGYEGWLVCELDETLKNPQESARINRRFLKGIGL
ncbi:MAG: TIM barrel protein [Candidatus Omnitrophica bacterium]|nr:TIM barrel protein [Candidatus Omnitrophota bacterium]